MPFTQADQEFVGATDTTVNNTGEDIMGVQARIPFLSNNKRSVTLVDTEVNIAGEDYFPP